MTIKPRRKAKRSPFILSLIGLVFLPVGLLKALRRRLLPALAVGLILAAIAGTATWFLMPPPKLTARTQLHISKAPTNPLSPESRPIDNEKFRNEQAYLIRDRFVLNAALREHPE